MGNPHPTKSKPFKIGRKHTGAPGIRTVEKKRAANQVFLAKQKKQMRAHKNR